MMFFITSCAEISLPGDTFGQEKCAQNYYSNFNICEGLTEGDEVPSCDDCNTCRCTLGSDGKLYPACTEIGCLP